MSVVLLLAALKTPLNKKEEEEHLVSYQKKNYSQQLEYNNGAPTSNKLARNVMTNTTGQEKDQFTVMLACTSDGGKLPTYVVLKRKTMPKDKFPAGVIVHVQKRWIDEGLVQDWVRMVWSSRLDGGLSRRRSMLVLDVLKCHKADNTKVLLRRTNTDLVIIPGGMTSLLQPIDVSINNPFKDGQWRCWSEWIMSVGRPTQRV